MDAQQLEIDYNEMFQDKRLEKRVLDKFNTMYQGLLPSNLYKE